jgi:hypothetical protein
MKGENVGAMKGLLLSLLAGKMSWKAYPPPAFALAPLQELCRPATARSYEMKSLSTKRSDRRRA